MHSVALKSNNNWKSLNYEPLNRKLCKKKSSDTKQQVKCASLMSRKMTKELRFARNVSQI